MASTTVFAQAIDALVAERDRVFIERVAADYGLPLEELKAKYLSSAEAAIKVPRKYTKKPKEVKVTVAGEEAPPPTKTPKAKAEKQCCTATTSAKQPCKFSALKGEVFCKRHLKASQEPVAEKAEKVAKPKVPKTKALEPVHTHELSAMTVETCDLCQSNGNPLVTQTPIFELTPVSKPEPREAAVSVEQRLAAILAEAEEYESECEEYESEDGMDEEEYEDE